MHGMEEMEEKIITLGKRQGGHWHSRRTRGPPLQPASCALRQPPKPQAEPFIPKPTHIF